MILVLLRRLNSTKEKKRLLRSLPSTKRETMPTAASTLALETVADCRSCDTTGLKVRITHPFHPYAGREFDLICRRRHWGEDRATTGGFARPQVLAFQRRLLAPAPQAMHVAAWSDSGRLPRPDASCCGVSLPVLGESNPPFTSGDDSWRLRRDLDYWVMTPQAMRSPALPAGSLL
jgi:hypothetical protein